MINIQEPTISSEKKPSSTVGPSSKMPAIPTAETASHTSTNKPKKKSKKGLLLSIVVGLLLLVGSGAGYWLTQQSQDIRQQASTPSYAGHTGYNYNTGQLITPGTQAWTDAIANGDQIAGTYYHGGNLYMIGGTETAWVKYAAQFANNPTAIEAINHSFSNPSDGRDTESRIITPRLSTTATDDTGYNAITLKDGKYYYLGIPITGTEYNGYFYIDQASLQRLNDNNLTWVPNGTGCGDITHDEIDCNAWHFTQCLNLGSGQNGVGCDVDNPNPTGTPHTPHPTTHPSPSPGPQCLDITLDNPDVELNEQTTFTCSEVTGADHYIFRVISPDSTITELAATGRVSEAYTVEQSGKYFAQCQICTGTVDTTCHEWEPLP